MEDGPLLGHTQHTPFEHVLFQIPNITAFTTFEHVYIMPNIPAFTSLSFGGLLAGMQMGLGSTDIPVFNSFVFVV